MKNSSLMRRGAVLAVGLGLVTGTVLQAQSVTTTTKEVTSNGTISSFEPNAFVIKSESAPAPITYNYTTTTRYVDDSGAVVTREAIRPGAPVTVYYTRSGDGMVASRVVVHHSTTAVPVPAATETTTTRTTTTTEQPMTKEEAKRARKHEKEMRKHPEREARREAEHGVPVPQASTETVTRTTSNGVVSSFAPDQFVIRSTTSEDPVTYRYTKTTQYVDDAGNPVTVDVVKSGAPVTVSYVREGDGYIAQRVIVHRHVGP